MKFPFLKVAVSQLFSKPSTENFPSVVKEAPEGYRGRIIFHADRCINCGLCMRVCSPAAIVKTIEKVEEGDKITMEFHLDSCTFCQMCSDFCSRNAIELSQDYLLVARKPEDLITRGTFIKKPPVKPAPKPAAPKPAEEKQVAEAACSSAEEKPAAEAKPAPESASEKSE